MSGDVQPRKRKDRKKKKEDASEAIASSRGVLSSPPVLQESAEVIHVQKELGLGGNACARIVFFCLLGALGVMVGVIITQYRGASEVETDPSLDSPWSQLLEGWVDNATPQHKGSYESAIREDSGEQSAESEEHNDSAEVGDTEDEEGSEEKEGSAEAEESEENERSEEVKDDYNEKDGNSAEDKEDKDDDSDEINATSDEVEDATFFLRNNNYDKAEGRDKSRKIDDSEEEVTTNLDKDEDNDDDDDISEENLSGHMFAYEGQLTEEIEDGLYGIDAVKDSSEEENEAVDEEAEDIGQLQTEHDGEEELVEESKEHHDDAGAAESEMDATHEADVVLDEEETGGVALKFGVGVALIVVAHFVLVKKWNNSVASGTGSESPSPGDESPTHEAPEMVFRRQTLVPPTHFVPEMTDEAVIAQDSEYSEDEDIEDMDEPLITETFEELRAQYSHLTPEDSPEPLEREDYATKDSDSPAESDPEGQSDPEELSEGEQEEDDEAMTRWKTEQLLQEIGTESESGESEDEKQSPPPTKTSWSNPKRSGQQDYAYADLTNGDDWLIKDELDAADAELNNGGTNN